MEDIKETKKLDAADVCRQLPARQKRGPQIGRQHFSLKSKKNFKIFSMHQILCCQRFAEIEAFYFHFFFR